MTEELAKKGLEYLATAVSITAGELPKLTEQFINYMAFQITIDLLGKLLWFVAIYAFYRGITLVVKVKKTELEAAGKDKDRVNSLETTIVSLFAVRLIATVLFTTLLISHSNGEIKSLGKLVIAPKVFLVEEGADFVKRFKK